MQALGQSSALFISCVYMYEWEELLPVLHSWENWDTNSLNNLFTFSQLVNKGAGIETQLYLIQSPLSFFFPTFLAMTFSPGPVAQSL